MEPDLATEWEFTDDLTFEVTLRDDVTFSDGTPFDADAVVANLERGWRPSSSVTTGRSARRIWSGRSTARQILASSPSAAASSPRPSSSASWRIGTPTATRVAPNCT
ncbi:MAG: ABC transporter substrate-binding protein [Ilumatobacteraceae bacterium]